MKCIYIIFILFFSQILSSKDILISENRNKASNKIKIEIDTKNPSIRINGRILNDFHKETIQKILGKPSRIKKDSFRSHMEEFSYEPGESPHSYPIKVLNTYYIYDKLGIMFYTESGKARMEEPNRFSIHFPNKRIFTHTKDLPFKPRNSFSGIFKINGNDLNAKDKILPDGVNYRTDEFFIFDASFGPTSFTTVIDSLYSVKSEPYMRIYLDDGRTQRISSIVLY